MNKLKRWCDSFAICNYSIENGLINVNGGVNLSNCKLKTLPYKFGNINGNFNISINLISSFKNFPNIINGRLNITMTLIDNWNYVPKVTGNIICDYHLQQLDFYKFHVAKQKILYG